jgi:osmoprotectant transport system ATP-binding protein
VLRLENVSKRFASTAAVSSVTLDCARGRTTELIGPSGCGKSTLLRCIVGLEQPDAGTIQFDGQTLGSGQLIHARRRIGYVIQEGGLFPHLTGYENVALLARYLHWESSRIDARVRALSGLVRLQVELLERYPQELSGGQRQRIGLMRALMLDPDLLLLDEPLGHLDPMIRFDLQQDLKRVFDTLKKTVVLVTHDLHEAAYLGHQIVLMRDGRIVQRGTADDLVRTPAEPFVAQFVHAQRAAFTARPMQDLS